MSFRRLFTQQSTSVALVAILVVTAHAEESEEIRPCHPEDYDAIGSHLNAYWEAASRSFQTMQACSVDPVNGNAFVAEAKLGGSHTVLALDEYEKGRIAYYCDMTTLNILMKSFPGLVQYLGRSPRPQVLVFGYERLCRPLESLPGFVYVGRELPAKFDGNASLLAGEYEVVIFTAAGVARDPFQWNASWGATLRNYARVEGRGLMLVGDYYRGERGICRSKEFDALNSIASDAQARFNKVDLVWGKAAWGKEKGARKKTEAKRLAVEAASKRADEANLDFRRWTLHVRGKVHKGR